MDIYEFEKWVFKNFKINLSAYKSNQLHRRINSLMSRVGVDSFEEYTKLLLKDEEQRQKFMDFITINVTEFFRNPDLFDELTKKIEKEILPNNKALKVWSAACSNGSEPYSLAMILDSLEPSGKCKITATDLDNTILNKAKTGEYQEAEIKNIKPEYIKKYFTKQNDKYIISSKIKSMVNFKKHDLILDDYDKGFDIIVCRNVVIYFNNDIKNNIYKKFHDSLKPGGLLFVGATESIYNYKEMGFEKSSTFIYRKA
ncbi:chemotaxis protein methyltransferase CheR [Clostridium amylolyticum]|uniref:protein-glutamate O-methyltransferase n=1 Tax=Clostridium amylolyticum TaxID=1121298 RepID=A0A1M6CC05_9CLOT|nr:protein-glutamate O-methyltransferase CheR [Clostridium amylolyticum]SHI58413.1 chemotaxis protein methyltransferase CheR [Clostridium amylolyticum]